MPLSNPRPDGGRPARGGRITRIAVILLVLVAPWWPLASSARGDDAVGPPLSTGQTMRTDTDRPALAAVPAAGAPAPPEGADSAGGERLEAEGAPVDPFVLIGVGFRSASGGTAQVRVRTDGTWGQWTALAVVADHDADAGRSEAAARGPADETGAPISEPVWVDHADGYQLDLPGDARSVEVFLVRETGEAAPVVPATEALGDAGAPEAGGEPSVHLRSSWGARPYRGTPDVAPPLLRAIVHHTVNTNSYSPAQVPGLLRSIQAYHQDARGWDDIGYNFVIDRFGGIWEGRAGGIRNPVIGAHAMDHNTGSTGVAYLGDATSSVTSAAVRSYGALLGWKLFLGGTRPTSSDILGHRNVGQTSCPGNALYARLPTIRNQALARYGALMGTGTFSAKSVSVTGSYTPLSGDFNGDAYDDVLWYGPGAAPDRLWWGGPNGFAGTTVTVNGTYGPVTGDFDGDGRADVFWYGRGDAPDRVWYGRTDGTFTSKDFTVGSDYTPVAGDFDGDGEHDVFWYGPGSARDQIWYGTTAENFAPHSALVDGTFTPFAGDFDGDHRSDIFWYGAGAAHDALWYGEVNGFSAQAVTVDGTYVPLVADYTGGGSDDILWYGAGGAADKLALGTSTRSFTSRAVAQNANYDAPFTGDWNADGRDDVFWYDTAGADRLWLATTN